MLAGVYDIKNPKIKFRPNEEKKYNSPWNMVLEKFQDFMKAEYRKSDDVFVEKQGRLHRKQIFG